MEVQSKSSQVVHLHERTNPTIACCNCGKAMVSYGLAMCTDCIRLSVDITSAIQKSGTLNFCKDCGRLHQYPNSWIYAPPESRELLASCLKRLRGLSKVRLIDAKFIWTEPHSRRIKLSITVQDEVTEFQNALIQQTFEVEFVEAGGQCPACAKTYTANTWRASIQVRQKVAHKKTFLYLEQLILKNHAHKNTVSIQESKEGLDFFYNQRNHALKMLDFLGSLVPARTKKASELISENIHTSEKSYKFSYMVEIVPICRDDLVVLPKKLARSLGNISQLTLCHGLGNTVHLIDPLTLRTTELNPNLYWRTPFKSLNTSKNLTDYVVLDIEPVGPVGHDDVTHAKFSLADATVARTSDLGRNDTTYYVRTHLGGILHPGDTVKGYELNNSNFNSDLWDELDKDRIPEVILVKKSYPDKRKNKGRNWKLKRMAKEYNDRELAAEAGRKKNVDRQDRDYEEFLEELEQDPEMRGEINLFKSTSEQNLDNEQELDINEEEEEDEEDDEFGIALEELKLSDEEVEEDDDEQYDGAEEEDDIVEHET